MRPSKLPIDKINQDGSTQVRVAIDADWCEHLASLLLAEDSKIPPIVVFFDGETYWIGDGYHRLAAAAKAGQASILALVHKGTQEDAVKFALGANRAHGKPLTTADKAKAIRIALRYYPERSDRWIAGELGVDHKTVAKHRAAGESTGEIPQFVERSGSDGKFYPSEKPDELGGEIPHLAKRSGSDGKSNPYEKPNEADADLDDIPLDFKVRRPSEGTEAVPEASEADDPDEPSGSKDCVGNPISGNAAEAFRRRSEINSYLKMLSRMKSEISKARESGDPLYADLNLSAFLADLGCLYRDLRFIRPHAVCGYCSGDGCNACHGRGWLSEMAYQTAPADMK